MKALRRFTVRAHLPDRLTSLERLSINLRWSWDKPTQDLFEAVDPELWKHVGCDPVALFGQVAPKRLDELAKDELMCDTLGDHIFQHFLQAKRAEWDGYIRHVSRWEIERYLNTY